MIIEIISACWDEMVNEPLSNHHPARLLSKMSQLNRFCLHEANKHIWKCINIRYHIEGAFEGDRIKEDFEMIIRDRYRAGLIRRLSLLPSPIHSSSEVTRRIIKLLLVLPNLQHLQLGYRNLDHFYLEAEQMCPNLEIPFPFMLKTFNENLSHSDFVAPLTHLRKKSIKESRGPMEEFDEVPADGQ
jgi:hypothetical protein